MKTITHLALLILAIGLAPLPAHGASKQWRGSPFNATWSNPNNWDPPGVPQDGDDLTFDDHGLPGLPPVPMVNDLTNLIVGNLAFPTGSWQLGGNELGVRGIIGISSDGLVEINCAIRLEGGGAIFSAFSTLPSDSSDLRFTGPINLNGRLLRLLARKDATVDLAGPISGNGQINLIVETVDFFSSGTVKFSGTEANTFTGSVILNSQNSPLFSVVVGSNLVLDKQSAIAVPGPLIVGTNCWVKLDRPHQIADTTAVSLGAGAHLLLQNNTETIDTLSMVGRWTGLTLGKSVVDTGAATLSVQRDITANNFYSNDVPVIRGQLGLPGGSHVIRTGGNQYYGLKIEASIIGEGGFTKTGTNGLILEGNSSFTGDAVIQEGGVDVTHNNGLGSPVGATILFGGELTLNGVAVANESLFVDRVTTRVPVVGALLNCVNVCSWSGPIEINTTNLDVVSGDVTFTGAISGSGAVRFMFNDRVQLAGPDANTYAGDTFTDASLLELNKPSGVVAFGGRLIVGSGRARMAEVRWLQDYQRVGAEVMLYSTPGIEALVNLNNHRDDFGPVTFNGGFIDTGATGELGLYGLVYVTTWEGDAIINGRIGLPPGHHEFHVDDASRSADLSVNAVVVGSGHLRKSGLGQMWLNGSNSYAGLTFVLEGSLVAFHAAALGAAATGTTVRDGASLILNAPNSTVPEPIALSGAGDGVHGALNIFGDVTLRNPFPSIFACLDLTTNATIRVEPSSRLVVNGFISGIGPLRKTGPGLLVLANINPNTYSGDTFVAEGVLNLSKPNLAIAVPGNLIVGPAPLNSSAIARWSTSGGMNPSAVATVNAGSLLDVNGNGLTLSRLNLNDGGDAQTGAGILSFGLGGMIAVGSLNQLGSHVGSSFTGNIGLPANAPLTFAVSPYAPFAPFDFNPELDVSANIAAPPENSSFERAGIAKSGLGTMRLIGDTSFNGRVEVLGGTFIAANSTALGSTFDGTFVQNNARLALEGSVNVENEILVLNSTAAPALESLSGESYWSDQVIMQRHSTVGTRASSTLQLAGVISGTANFTKIGPGTLRFGGGSRNTYTGETFINEGVFLLGKPFTITAVPGPLSIGTPAGEPAVAANLTGYQIVGNIFVNRGGLYNVNGQEENVDHLWLYEGGDVQTTSGFLFLKTGGSIRVLPEMHSDPSTISGNLGLDPGQHDIIVAQGSSLAGTPELTIDAVVSQPLSTTGLQKNGAGTLRLTANNTYSGMTVANEGVLRVDGSQPGSRVQIHRAGTLQGVGTVGLVDFMNSGGAVAPGASPGILNCSSFNSAAQGAGILRIELNGSNPGANGYDRLNVNGTVTLSGIALNLTANFSPNTNQQFIVINNDGSDPVAGAFNGLPQDASVFAGNQEFRISYSGGTGNDVVLTRIFSGPPPALRIEAIPPTRVRLLWPTNDPAFRLQFGANLTNSNWTAALPAPVVTGTNYVVTNATSGTDISSTVTTVAWYRLGEDDPGALSGLPVTNTSRDSAGTSHLTPFGSPTYTSAVSPDAAVRAGSSLAVNFNGVDQLLNGAVVSTAVNNFGIEAWVRPNSAAGASTGIAYNGAGFNGWGLIQSGSEFSAAYGGVTVFVLGPVTVGAWTHLALVRDNGTTRLYYNGAAVGTSASAPNAPTGGFEIGHRFQPIFNEYFNGMVDEVRVFTFAPGQFRLNDLLINQTLPPQTAPPAKFYRLVKP